MAKYDQGGGCACGLYRECCCELNLMREDMFPKPPVRQAFPRVRLKVTDAMVETAVEAFYDYCVEEEGITPPSEAEDPEPWAKLRKALRKSLERVAREHFNGA